MRVLVNHFKFFTIISCFSLVSALSVLASASKDSAAEFKVAIVDMQKALQNVESGKKAKATLEKEYNEKKKALEQEEASIQKITAEFQKQASVLSDEAKMKKQSELQERILKYRNLYGKSQEEIQKREHTLTAPIISKLREIVESLGNERGYIMILEKNEGNVLYLKAKDDLTDEVIKRFNKS